MENKKLMIILLAAIIILAILSLNFFKSDVNLDVHGERISNTSDAYIICKILDNDGNVVDTSIGKLSIGFQFNGEDENAMGEAVLEPLPLKNGISIIRENDPSTTVSVHYDGGYFYNPAEYSGALIVKNSTNLTDDDLTPPY